MTQDVHDGKSQRRTMVLLAIVGILLAGALLFGRPGRLVAAVATLGQCLGGWPVAVFDGEDWRSALPRDVRDSAGRQIPIAAWPSGLHFDEAGGALLDAQGGSVFRVGDRVQIQGSIVEVDGDPAPCFLTLGVKVDAIVAH